MAQLLVILSACVAFGEVEHSVYVRDEASGEGSAIAPSDGCNDYDVRLVGGNDSYSGIVEACYSTDTNTSLWGPLCAFGLFAWTPGTAVTICGQLNFSTTDAVTIQYENVPGPYSYQVYCNNDNPPSTLGECVTDEHQPLCPRMIAGGVKCEAPPECPEGDVRLVDGYSVDGRTVAGRLEVCVNGVWGTVCRLSQWTSVEAAVVCRQLGINATVPIGEGTLRYGMGSSSQPVHLENVYCSGDEDNILQCSHKEIGCSHETDAGVICEAQPGSCRDGDIRLRDGIEGLSTVSGFVQVCFTGIWGIVCGVEGWDDVAGSVACRQLGHEFGSTDVRPGQNASVQNLLAGVNCSGSEERVADCDHDGVGVVGVGCNRAYVTCIKNMSTTGPPTGNTTEATADSNTEIITGSVVGGVVLLLTVTAVVVTLVLCILRERTVRRKVEYNLENARQSITEYVEMRGRGPSNYLLDHTMQSDVKDKPFLEFGNKNKIFSKTQIQASETIGQGEFGLVYKAYVDTATGKELVAIKTSKALFSEKEKGNLVKEVMTMSSFEHVNLMRLIGVCFDADMPQLIMPFMDKGSVLEYVRTNKEKLMQDAHGSSRQHFLGMCRQITSGMKYLAAQKFVHRDLAARNCMIDGSNVIKVADFGLSEDMYSSNYFRRDREETEARDEMVPIRWMAPESIESDRYDERTDVWAFGVTCWEIFTCGSVPYSGIRAMKILQLLKTGERLQRPTNDVCSDEIYHIMSSCWSDLPTDRPDFTILYTIFDDLLERDSGYLDLSLLPDIVEESEREEHLEEQLISEST